MRYFITILLCFLLIGCNGYDGKFDIRKPVSFSMDPPPGPPEYRQGWKDGCESGSDAYTSDLYKMINAFQLRQDPVLRNNKMYYQVWKDAFLYCAIAWETINRSKI